MAATIRIAILANAVKAKVEMKSVGKDADKMGERLSRAGEKVKEVTRNLLKMGGKLAGVASLMGPLSAGLLSVARSAAAVGQGVASMAPLIAFAPAVIGGLQLLKFTLAGIGKEMGEQLKPLGDAFEAAQKHAGALASRTLPRLAAEFKRVNLPTISRGMDSIGRSTGQSVTMFGKWVNSAPGMKVIEDVTDGVARAFAKAAPAMTKAAMALLGMTGRANVADRLSSIGTVVERLADKFTRWANSVTSGDIEGALKKVGNAAGIFSGKIQAIKDIVTWMGDNQATVKAFSDTLAILGIAFGGPVGIAIGSFTLLSNHWTETKAAFNGTSSWWSGIWAKMKADPGLQSLGSTVMESARKVLDAVRPFAADFMAKVMPALQSLGQVIRKDVVPAFDAFLKAVTPVVTWLIRIFGPAFNAVFVGIINIVKGAFQIIAGLFNVIAGLLTGDWSRLWNGIKQILSGAWAIIKAVVSAGWAAVKALFKAGIGAIVAIVKGAGNALWDAGKAIMDGLWRGLKSGWENVKGFLSSVTNQIPDWKGPLDRDKKLLVGAGKAVMDGFRRGLESQYSGVRASLGGFTGDLSVGAATRVESVARVESSTPGWAAELLALLRQPTRLEIGSDGGRVGDVLLELLRERVTAKGGKAVVLGIKS